MSSRFTFGAADEIAPTWSPDGTRIVFSDNRSGTFDLYEKAATGQGEEKLLVHSDELKIASDWSRDGRYIAYSNQSKETGFDIFILPTFGDRKPITFLKTQFNELLPVFSPDGRFIAYQSNESGRRRSMSRAFRGPAVSGRSRRPEASEPNWRADGKEIVYRAPDQNLMAVEVKTGDSFQAGVPKPLFPARTAPGIARNRYIASARRPAVSHRRSLEARVDDADHRRAELGGRAGQVAVSFQLPDLSRTRESPSPFGRGPG